MSRRREALTHRVRFRSTFRCIAMRRVGAQRASGLGAEVWALHTLLGYQGSRSTIAAGMTRFVLRASLTLRAEAVAKQSMPTAVEGRPEEARNGRSGLPGCRRMPILLAVRVPGSPSPAKYGAPPSLISIEVFRKH